MMNNLKIALRLLRKHRVFSFINLAGLAVGISASLLIMLYVLDELSYDRFYAKADRICRLTNVMHLPDEDRAQAMTSPAMGQWLKDSFPEVASTVRIGDSERTLSYGAVRIHNTRIWYADSTLFDIFSYPMLKGDPRKALVEPYSIVLSESSAKKFFGSEDPLGKTMTFSDTISLHVTGIIADLPANTHLHMDVILSRTTVEVMWNLPEYNKDWYYNVLYTYVLLNKNQDAHALEAKIKPVLQRQMAIEQKARGSNISYDFFLQPVADIHLRSHLHNELGVNGDIAYIYTFIVVALLVLLIACANYVNLSTARSVMRYKEVGIRKVVGARRSQLVTQLLGESFLTTAAAGALALTIVYFALPAFNSFTGRTAPANLFYQPQLWMITTVVFLFVSVLAGVYPALFISALSPLKILQNKVRAGRANFLIRKGLVIFQFSISIVLVIGVLIIYRQMDFIRNRNLGLSKDQLVELKLLLPVQPKYELIKSEMAMNPGVIRASASDFSYTLPTGFANLRPGGSGESDYSTEAALAVDNDFIGTFGIELAAGRDFARTVTEQERRNFIINEAMAKQFGWRTPEEAIGRDILFEGGFGGKVIGVARDFNFTSLREKVKPLIMHLYTRPRYITLKLSTTNIQSTIDQLQDAWNRIQTEFPFDYAFVDDNFRKLYIAEEQTQVIIGALSGLAITIACLGLFALAAFMAEQRMKEISIRKVLGADVLSIAALLSREFIMLIFISILVAVPIAWYSLDTWLQTFAYRTSIPWWIYAVAGMIAVAIAQSTISYQSIRAATKNPIDTLKSE